MVWRLVSAAFFSARDRLGDGLRLPWPISVSRSTFLRVAADPLADADPLRVPDVARHPSPDG